jgi:hypothetical protein
MHDGLSPCFIAKYVGLYEIVAKLYFDMYTLKLPTSFMAHMTFHVLKSKLFFETKKCQTENKRCDKY